MLTIENISLKLEGRVIIKELSCSFFQNSVTLISGLDEIGNNLLLRTLAGLFRKYQGEIFVQQHNIKGSLEAYRNDINYIGEKDGMKSSLSVMDNISYWAEIYATEILIPTAFHFFELEELGDVLVKDLSLEQKKRVALTRLILRPTPIWYLENPFAYLEDAMKKKFCNMIEVRAREGGIVLLTSSDADISVENNKINLSDFMV